MHQFLDLDPADRQAAFEQAGRQRGLVTVSVEKDFWVCWTLKELFAMPGLGPHLTFKGGTSLSKAWGLIDRFSEDIDLTISRDAPGFSGIGSPAKAESRARNDRRLQALKGACGALVKESLMRQLAVRIETIKGGMVDALTFDEDDPDGQTLLFSYPSQMRSSADRYLAPQVKIELGARSDPWPVESRPVTAIVAEIFPELFAVPAFTVSALVPRRTFWEKAMLLHEENLSPPGRNRQPRLARHYYDLHRLIQQGIGEEALRDVGLFQAVVDHRALYFRRQWVDYETLKPGKLRVVPFSQHEPGWRKDYGVMQGEMFSTPPPSFDEILATIRAFEEKLDSPS